MKHRWQICDPDPRDVSRVQKFLGCHPVTAAVLVNRGFSSETSAFDFLHPSLKNLQSPFLLPDMEKGAQRLSKAVLNGERILVFGDYDVDGVTATAILVEFLQAAGGHVSYYIPDRVKDGYGLQRRHVPEIIAPSRATLVVTVDCGSSSSDAAAAARDLGVDVLVTDHHEISDPRPEVTALINPKMDPQNLEFHLLAGVGVAFSLIIATRTLLRQQGHWKRRPEPNLRQFCDLVAIGTIADLVPLRDQNRIFVRTGIDVINSDRRPGLKALKEISAVDRNRLGPGDIAFRLAPRINAAGRMAQAAEAVELLITHDMEKAAQISRALDGWNRLRKEAEQTMLDQIDQWLLTDEGARDRPCIVLKNEGWHEGVLGIVASRLARAYGKPAVLLRESDGICKGSARSVPGFDLYRGLSAVSPMLLRFGGHPMAAGLQVASAMFEGFRDHLEHHVRENTPPGGFETDRTADAVIAIDEISDSLADDIEKLRPFGNGNPEPVFIAERVKVNRVSVVGEHHLRMTLDRADGPGANGVSAIWYRAGWTGPAGSCLDRVAFHVRWNRWNGSKTLQVVVLDTG